MRKYNFHLKAGKALSLSMDTNAQGFILLNRFVPDYFNVGYGNPIFGGEIHALEASEFETDCMKMVNCFNDNNLNYRDGQHCFNVLNAVVEWHVERFGRIIFGDLMTYTSEMCELMAAMGYSLPVLKTLYPNFIVSCIEIHGDFVKESVPSFGGFGAFGGRPQTIKFTDTPRYARIVEMCPRLSGIPRI